MLMWLTVNHRWGYRCVARVLWCQSRGNQSEERGGAERLRCQDLQVWSGSGSVLTGPSGRCRALGPCMGWSPGALACCRWSRSFSLQGALLSPRTHRCCCSPLAAHRERHYHNDWERAGPERRGRGWEIQRRRRRRRKREEEERSRESFCPPPRLQHTDHWESWPTVSWG